MCMYFRLRYSFKHRNRRILPLKDDFLVVVVAITALASMLTKLATVTDVAIAGDATHPVESDGWHIISYASTILFVLALNLSRLPLFLWLARLHLPGSYKIFTTATGCVILTCMLATASGVIFQCQLPKPWSIQSGHCISSVSGRANTPADMTKNLSI